MLTDQDIDKAWRSQNYTADYDTFRMAVGRAIEAAAVAPLMAQIADLEANAHTEIVRLRTENAELKSQLAAAQKEICHLSDQLAYGPIDAAIARTKEQP